MFIFTASFNFNSNTPNGRFIDRDSSGTGPLDTSLNWLRLDVESAATTRRLEPLLPTSPPPPAPPAVFSFDVHAENWFDLGDAGTLRIPSPAAATNPYPTGVPFDHIVGIYVSQASGGPTLDAAATVQMAACFGRPIRSVRQQDFASPFRNPGRAGGPGKSTDPVQTTFISEAIRRNAAPGWFFLLQQIAHRPTGTNGKFLAHRYEFALGVTVTDVTNNIVRYYGDDPEMDLGDN